MVAASTAASALYKYTYTLGRSLYVPLTSRCNTVPLPQTRGPGFLLPKEVAEALVRVRQAEQTLPLDFDLTPYESGMDDNRVSLPPYDMPLVNGLYPPTSLASFTAYNQQKREMSRDVNNNYSGLFEEDSLEPSITTLVEEVVSRLQPDQSGSSDGESPVRPFDSVVIAGEGEPTLRMEALLAVARTVQSLGGSHEDTDQRSQHSSKNSSRPIPVRLITNGLCYGIHNFGYSTKNTLFPPSRHVVLRDLKEAGISRISVALNTPNRHEYDISMSPCCYSVQNDKLSEAPALYNSDNDDAVMNNNNQSIHGLMPGTAHDLVCEFIMEAAKVGIEVEITAIERREVDKFEMERFARMLLSVSKNRRRTEKMRWRKYFY